MEAIPVMAEPTSGSDCYQRLALAILERAAVDFVRGHGTDQELYSFLKGETEAAQFWYALAGREPLRGTAEQVLEALQSRTFGKKSTRHRRRSLPKIKENTDIIYSSPYH